MAKSWRKTVITASEERAPRTRGPTSAHAVRIGPLVFVTGQSGRRPGAEGYVDDPAEHARQTMENIKAILEQAGSSFEHVIKRTVHIANPKVYQEKMRSVVEGYFITPVASTTLQGGLMRDDMLLEVEVIAVVPGWEEAG